MSNLSDNEMDPTSCGDADRTVFAPAAPSTADQNAVTQPADPAGPAQSVTADANTGRAEVFDSSSSIAGEQSSAVIGETSTEHRIVTFQFDRGIISLNGIERLRRIADDLREIEAPQILDIQTVDILDDGCRVVMSPVSGSTLEQLLKTRQPSWLESLQLMTEVVKALVPVHERGMGHGCLKPSRIFLRDLQLTNIVDFGLSLVSGELSNSHDCDAFVCAAPENVQSQRFPLTPQMDVYGVGVLLYRLICGRFPFRADNQSELLRQIQEDPVQPPRQLAPDIPRELEQLCLSCLAKHPADRPPSARELWKSLNRLLVSHQKSTLESSSDSLSQSAVRRLGGQRPATIRRVMLLETEPKDGVLLAVFSTLLERLGIYPEPWSGDGLLFPLPETGSQSDWSVPFADRVLRCLRAAVKEQQSRDASLSENGTVFSIRVSSARLSIRPDRDQPVEPELLERRLVQLEAKIENGNIELCNRGYEFLIRGLYCDESKIVGDSPNIGTYRIADRDGVKLTVRASQVRNQLPLSGRDPQFQMLKSRWEQACEGMGQVVLLIGDEGMGKTRMVRELVSHATASEATGTGAVRTIVWNCRPFQSGQSLHPFLYWLKHSHQLFNDEGRDVSLSSRIDKLLQTAETSVVDAAGILGSELRLSGSSYRNRSSLTATQRREQSCRIMLDWLKGQSQDSPLLFIIEDLQWVDPATLGFLTLLVDAGFNDRIMTVLTFRPEFETPWGSRAHQTQVALNRLTKRHAKTLIEAASASSQISQEYVDQILTRTDGIPLYIEAEAKNSVSK